MSKIVPKGSRKSTNPADPKTPALADANTSHLTFVSRKAQIKVPIASCELKRTIEGASSITPVVHDPDFIFLNSDALKGKKKGELESELTLENLVFALSGIGLGTGHLVEAILEEDAVYRLRQFDKPLTMSRSEVTRARFIKHMFDEAGIPFVCHELDVKQPIESAAEAETAANKDRKRKPGFSAHAALTVKTVAADSEQRENIETAMDVAASHESGELAAEALLVSIIQENEARSNNILQLESFNLAGDHVSATDVAGQCAIFLTKGFTGKGGAIALAREHPSWTPGEIAIAVQGPKNKDPTVYQVWAAEAKKMVDAYTGSDAEALQGNQTFAKEYQYRRGGPNGEREDSWKCARRLAEEVNWYLFIVAGTGYFMSGKQLKRSRTRILVAPGADGLISHPTGTAMTSPLFDDTVTVTWHASKWGAPPGSIAELEGYGALDDRWVVISIERPTMKSSVTTVTLGRAQKAKKEPAHEVGQRTSAESGALEGGRATALAAYEAAKELSGFKLPYLWGGGHGAHELDKVANGGVGLDCSGAVCWDLFKCGMRESDTAETSGELAQNFGEAGEGKYMTVWANAIHAFIEFKIPGKPHSRLDTVPAEGEENGPRLRPFSPRPEPTNQAFTPRHFPGQ